MIEVGPQHSIEYRHEIAKPFFDRLQSGGSCSIVGAPSVGKSRFLRFLMRSDVQVHYLAEHSNRVLLLRADCNRMQELSSWGLSELMLTATYEGCEQHPESKDYKMEFARLREPIIEEQNPVLALRHLELAIRALTMDLNFKLCFLLDEFDNPYQKLPGQVLANLRSLRDENKYRLSYTLFLRDPLEYLRPPGECEGFYELFSRSVLGLRPYQARDSMRMLEQLEVRRSHKISDNFKKTLVQLSGGHPGLLLVLFDLEMEDTHLFMGTTGLDALGGNPMVVQECSKIFGDLSKKEQAGLVKVSGGKDLGQKVHDRLTLKGLIISNGSGLEIFSPLFDYYIKDNFSVYP